MGSERHAVGDGPRWGAKGMPSAMGRDGERKGRDLCGWEPARLRARQHAVHEVAAKTWLQHDGHAVDATEHRDGAHDMTRVDVLPAQTCV